MISHFSQEPFEGTFHIEDADLQKMVKVLNDVNIKECPYFDLSDKYGNSARYYRENQWIPCSERLPKVGDTYIVTGKQKWSNQKEWEYFTDAAIYEPVGAYIDDCWTTWNDWIEGQETHIIAWMEMPEPWKGEEE